MTSGEVKSVIESLQKDGRLPAKLTQGTVDAMTKSLTRYFGQAAGDKIGQFTDKARAVAEAALKTEQETRVAGQPTVTVGVGKADARAIITEFIEANGVENIAETMNMDFFLRIAGEVASGAAQHVAQNFDETRLDEFPALEFHRVYERDVPRGTELVKGAPQTWNAWDDADGRWQAACDEAGDEAAQQVFDDTGRCVALKSSGVWQALGDGAGGYDDTLGNPFAPFAFNSGWMTDEVPRAEAVELGLLEEDDEAEPAKTDFDNLFAMAT